MEYNFYCLHMIGDKLAITGYNVQSSKEAIDACALEHGAESVKNVFAGEQLKFLLTHMAFC